MKTYPRAQSVDEALRRATNLVSNAERRYNRVERAKERFGITVAEALLMKARFGLERAERELYDAPLVKSNMTTNASYILLRDRIMTAWSNIEQIVEQVF